MDLINPSVWIVRGKTRNQSPLLATFGHPWSACNFTNSANSLISSSFKRGPNVHCPLGVQLSPNPFKQTTQIIIKMIDTAGRISIFQSKFLQAFFPCHSMWYGIYRLQWQPHSCRTVIQSNKLWEISNSRRTYYLSRSFVKSVAP